MKLRILFKSPVIADVLWTFRVGVGGHLLLPGGVGVQVPHPRSVDTQGREGTEGGTRVLCYCFPSGLR